MYLMGSAVVVCVVGFVVWRLISGNLQRLELRTVELA